MTQQVLTLSEIYGILGKELKTNTVILGIDQAQNNTGLCLLRTTEDKLYVEDFWSIEMKGKGKGNLHKMLLHYKELCRNVRKDLPDVEDLYKRLVIIEDCYLGLSVWTTKVLSKYATVSYFVFRKWADNIPDPIQPLSVRKKVGFSQDCGKYHYEMVKNRNGELKRKKIWDRKPLDLKEQIINFIENKFSLTVEDADLADAFMLALSGLVK